MTLTDFRSKPKVKTKVLTEARFITIWGPPGSTGKSTIAFNLAFELAALGQRVLLLDLDTCAPAISQMVSESTTTAGLAGAARLIRQGRFSLEELDRLSVALSHKRSYLRFLPGLSNPMRWPEITPETIQQLKITASHIFDFVISDVASPIEDKLSAVSHSTFRNSATRTALAISDQVIVSLHGTQISLARYLANFAELDELQKSRILLINKASPSQSRTVALRNLTKDQISAHIPSDESTMELAENQRLPISLVRRKSLARTAIAALAHKLLAWQP